MLIEEAETPPMEQHINIMVQRKNDLQMKRRDVKKQPN
jgi:hypothetical protein